MLMPPFTLHHPNSIAEAISIASNIISEGETFDWVAGGTDVLPNYKWRINPKPHVISLANIPEAKQLSPYDIGCMTPLSQLTEDNGCLLYTSPSPRDVEESRMPSSA